MKFECGDLERALANPDLMPEAKEHLKACAACRQEYRLWTDVSAAARELHVDWESKDLWPRIQAGLEAEQKSRARQRKDWKLWALAAAAIFLAVATPLVWHYRFAALPAQTVTQDHDFLTEQALVDVEKSEAAYRKSIDQLARLAKPKLENSSSALAVSTQEKLLMLDAAIADTRSNVASNRFNLRLQTTLADLYQEKQQTLKELLTSEQNN
jgi:predicted anti-sigma-YlaC factor YlaD